MRILFFLLTCAAPLRAMEEFPKQDPRRDQITRPIPINNSSNSATQRSFQWDDEANQSSGSSSPGASPRSSDGSPGSAGRLSFKERLKSMKHAASTAKSALSPRGRTASQEQLEFPHATALDEDDIVSLAESPTLADSPRKEQAAEQDIEFDAMVLRLSDIFYHLCHADEASKDECHREYIQLLDQMNKQYTPEKSERAKNEALSLLEQRIAQRVQNELTRQRVVELQRIIDTARDSLNE